MDDSTFREHLLAWLKAIGDGHCLERSALIDQGVAMQKQHRQGTLRVKIDAPAAKRRRKVRRA